MTGHTWQEKLAFVGLEWKIVTRSRFRVQVRYPQGRADYGDGETLEEALGNGAIRMGIDWSSVERKMTDAAWAAMAHC